MPQVDAVVKASEPNQRSHGGEVTYAEVTNAEQPASASQPRRLRIAHVQLLPLLTGVQRVTLAELAALDPDRYERTLICQRPGPLTKLAANLGVRYEFVPQLTRPISPLRDAAALYQLWRLMRARQFDIVHTHSSKTGVLGRVAARMAGIPVITHTVHGFAFPAEPSRWKRRLYAALEAVGGRCCDAVICLNSSDRQVATELGVSEKKLSLVPNGVDLIGYHPISPQDRNLVRQRLGLPCDQPVAVMVGRLWPQKDPATFVKAAIAAIEAGQIGHFAIIGDGRLRSELKALLSEHHTGERIHLLGWRDDVAQVLPAFDVFVLPSRWEGMPLAILEAMACALPCVVSDIPGNRSLIDDGVDGYVVPIGDVEAFRSKLGILMADSSLRQAFGQAARSKVEQHYSMSRRMDAITALYQRLLDETASNKR